MSTSMELRSHASTNKILNYLRLAFLMMRRSFASKSKLLMDINLLIERIKSHCLVFHHPSSRGMPAPPFGGRRSSLEYEFSCSNSPDQVFYRAAKRRHAFFFPCLHPAVLDDVPPVVALPPTQARIAFSPGGGLQCAASRLSEELGQGEWRWRTQTSSPLSVRASDFSSEDAGECGVGGRGPSRAVDDEAEEFIRRFYEQLRTQSRMALLQYQE